MAKKRRRRSRSKRAGLNRGSAPRPAADTKQPVDAKTPGEQQEGQPSVLTEAIRLAGLAPIALLVGYLASHELWPSRIQRWLQPIIEQDVAVLTLSAGHAAIIGLLISNKGRFTPSTVAMLIAAVATALAGYRTIGESTSGVVIALMLLLLTVPAVWAEALSARIRRGWVYVRSLKGISTILLGMGLVGIVYFQSRDEDYIKNFILIPLAILAGIALVAFVIWLLLKLAYKYVPPLSGWLRSRVAAAYRGTGRRDN